MKVKQARMEEQGQSKSILGVRLDTSSRSVYATDDYLHARSKYSKDSSGTRRDSMASKLVNYPMSD